MGIAYLEVDRRRIAGNVGAECAPAPAIDAVLAGPVGLECKSDVTLEMRVSVGQGLIWVGHPRILGDGLLTVSPVPGKGAGRGANVDPSAKEGRRVKLRGPIGHGDGRDVRVDPA